MPWQNRNFHTLLLSSLYTCHEITWAIWSVLLLIWLIFQPVWCVSKPLAGRLYFSLQSQFTQKFSAYFATWINARCCNLSFAEIVFMLTCSLLVILWLLESFFSINYLYDRGCWHSSGFEEFHSGFSIFRLFTIKVSQPFIQRYNWSWLMVRYRT